MSRLADRLAWEGDEIIIESVPPHALSGFRASEFDEAKHPRVPKGGPGGGEFTDGGKFSEGGEGATVKKAPPASKDQIQQAWEMKQKGASYAQIQKATGLNPKQAATIVFKVNKKLKEEEAKKSGQPLPLKPLKIDKTNIPDAGFAKGAGAYKDKGFDNTFATVKKNADTGKWELKDANGKLVGGTGFVNKKWAVDAKVAFVNGTLKDPSATKQQIVAEIKAGKSPGGVYAAPAAKAPEPKELLTGTDVKVPVGTTVAGNGNIVTPKGESYVWQEKTTGPQAGKWAYFKDGVQVSTPKAKEDWKAAVSTIHNGLGPGGQSAVAQAPKPAYKPYVDDKVYNEVVAKGSSKVGDWPIADGVTRTMGTKYKEEMSARGYAWEPKLTAAERGSVKNYTGSGYSEINSELRKPGGPTSHLTSIKNIESAIEKHDEPPPPELVWRGISHGSAQTFAKDLGPGDVVTLKGFQSTSISPDKAHSWGSGQTIYEIKPSKGAYVKVVSSHQSEYEYLLPHGAEYVVRGHASVKFSGYGDKVKVVQLEMLPYKHAAHGKAA